MLDKYFLSCVVFSLIKNAVGDISLDYYFGSDDALRWTSYMENCNDNKMQEVCQKHCGPNHACLLGKCFCVDMKPQIKEDVIERVIQRSKSLNQNQKDLYNEHSSSESEDSSSTDVKTIELTEHPALRHHIAHFCPNLDVARECILKCMKIGRPAFCGKDHVCYCSHKYDKRPDNNEENIKDGFGAFQDLYKKYFGPRD